MEKLEKVAGTEKEFRYRHICVYAFAYHLTPDDRIWLYNKLKEKNITILGEDPTARPEDKPKEYTDYSHKDYDALYDEIVRRCEALRPLVEKARRIRPPQRNEPEQLGRRISEGDDSARERLIEMYLRTALAFGLRWSKLLDVDLQEAVGDALEGLVMAARSYSPGIYCRFSVYNFYCMRYTTMKGQPAHNPQVPVRKHKRENYARAYCELKKWGCLGCDRLADCDEALQKVTERLNCGPEEGRMAVRASSEPLSLEACLETAGHSGYEGQCDDIREEEDDAPEYEKGLAAYCSDASAEAEAELDSFILRQRLEDQLCRLTPREKAVLELRNGLCGGKEHTLEEIGRRYGVSKQRIRQNEWSAERKLRKKGSGLKKYL